MLRLQQKPGVLDMKNFFFEGLCLKTRIRRFNTVLVCMGLSFPRTLQRVSTACAGRVSAYGPASLCQNQMEQRQHFDNTKTMQIYIITFSTQRIHTMS